MSVHQCIYDVDKQKDTIRRVVIQFTPPEWEEVHSGRKSMNAPMTHSFKYMLNRLATIAPEIKHKAFEEEKEWRIVKDFDRSSPEKRKIENHAAFENIKVRPVDTVKANGDFLKFRENKGILIPYLSLPLVDDINDPYQYVKFSEVFVGPGAQQGIAVVACETLLKGWGIRCPVNSSIAPYRK